MDKKQFDNRDAFTLAKTFTEEALQYGYIPNCTDHRETAKAMVDFFYIAFNSFSGKDISED